VATVYMLPLSPLLPLLPLWPLFTCYHWHNRLSPSHTTAMLCRSCYRLCSSALFHPLIISDTHTSRTQIDNESILHIPCNVEHSS
jgi:hypothetical protein